MKRYIIFILLLFYIIGGATDKNTQNQPADSVSKTSNFGLLGLLGLLGLSIPLYDIIKRKKDNNQSQQSSDYIGHEAQAPNTKYDERSSQIKRLEDEIDKLKTTLSKETKRLEEQTDSQMDEIYQYIKDRNTKEVSIASNSLAHQMIDNITPITSNKTSDIYFIGTPSDDNPISNTSKDFNDRDYYYEIEIDHIDSTNASFRISNLANIDRMMGLPNSYITPACECNSTNFETGKKIQTIKDGKLQKRGNEWFLVEKSIIQII